MLDTLRQFSDRLLGRGSAAITVPVMDGTLKPNRVLDQATVLVRLPGIDDLATGGVGHQELWASAGNALYRLDGEHLVEQRRFEAPVSAFAFSASGLLAVALGGRSVQVLGHDGKVHFTLQALAGQPLVAVNALAWDGEDAIVFTDGSQQFGPEQWSHDLMHLGKSGRAGRWPLGNGQAELLASGLEYAFGARPSADGAGGVLIAESWRHRLVLRSRDGTHRGTTPLAELPGYPSRMAPASDGGFWLTCFVCRTQLVEFVLREPAYRLRMVKEIAPHLWIAPALSTGHSFQEPLQGAGVKNMGVLKPWAPPRSYGLVIKLDARGHIQRSLHSQVDGSHHGITAVAELGGYLYAASKGSGRLLRVDLQANNEGSAA